MPKQRKLTPRCYCCGEQIHKTFALISYSNNVDRAFLFKPEHVAKVVVGESSVEQVFVLSAEPTWVKL